MEHLNIVSFGSTSSYHDDPDTDDDEDDEGDPLYVPDVSPYHDDDRMTRFASRVDSMARMLRPSGLSAMTRPRPGPNASLDGDRSSRPTTTILSRYGLVVAAVVAVLVFGGSYAGTQQSIGIGGGGAAPPPPPTLAATAVEGGSSLRSPASASSTDRSSTTRTWSMFGEELTAAPTAPPPTTPPPTTPPPTQAQAQGPTPAPGPSAFLFVGPFFDMFPLHLLRCTEVRAVWVDPLYHYRNDALAKPGETNPFDDQMPPRAVEQLLRDRPHLAFDAAGVEKVADQVVRNLRDTLACDRRPAPSALDGFELLGRTVDFAGHPAVPRIEIAFKGRGVARSLLFVVGRVDEVDFDDPSVLGGLRVTTLAYSGAGPSARVPTAEAVLCPPGVPLWLDVFTQQKTCGRTGRETCSFDTLRLSDDAIGKHTARRGFRIMTTQVEARARHLPSWLPGRCAPPPLNRNAVVDRLVEGVRANSQAKRIVDDCLFLEERQHGATRGKCGVTGDELDKARAAAMRDAKRSPAVTYEEIGCGCGFCFWTDRRPNDGGYINPEKKQYEVCNGAGKGSTRCFGWIAFGPQPGGEDGANPLPTARPGDDGVGDERPPPSSPGRRRLGARRTAGTC